MRARGMSLLTVMIVVAVLVFLVAGALVFTGRELAGAAQHKRREELASCAAGARNLVMAQVRTDLTAKTGNTNIMGEVDTNPADPNDGLLIRTGHLDQVVDGGSNAVTRCTDPVAVSQLDLTNVTWGDEQGGTRLCYRMVAHCMDKRTRDRTEVEFEMRVVIP
ncbi:MAG: hypothetical protein HYZ28_23830 [Myxococcales bacterium]|nr:hypothetical protein [Myxococcales bacterium]